MNLELCHRISVTIGLSSGGGGVTSGRSGVVGSLVGVKAVDVEGVGVVE